MVVTTGNDMSYRPRGLWSTSPENRMIAACVDSLEKTCNCSKDLTTLCRFFTTKKQSQLMCIIHHTHTHTSTTMDTVLSVARAHSAHQSVWWLLTVIMRTRCCYQLCLAADHCAAETMPAFTHSPWHQTHGHSIFAVFRGSVK